MAWQDRDYNRDDRSGPPGGRGGMGRVLGMLNLGIPFGRWFGIRVRVHITFVLLLFFEVWSAWSRSGSSGAIWTLRWSGLLFVSVLLHEFGHCFGCRAVGGRADNILMWPLGGLAYCEPPERPWPHFVTVFCGPLVTFLLTVIPFAVIKLWLPVGGRLGLDPFALWGIGWQGGVYGVLMDVYRVNYTLLLFNLCLVFYPFDGGRLVQIAMWKIAGFYKSMLWATTIGMAGAGAVAAYGVINGNAMIVFIAVFGFIKCFQQNQVLRTAGPSEPAFDPGYYNTRENERVGWLSRLGQRRAAGKRRHKEAQNAKLEAEVDRILAKVKDHGLHSLSASEKRTLQRATERQRRVG